MGWGSEIPAARPCPKSWQVNPPRDSFILQNSCNVSICISDSVAKIITLYTCMYMLWYVNIYLVEQEHILLGMRTSNAEFLPKIKFIVEMNAVICVLISWKLEAMEKYNYKIYHLSRGIKIRHRDESIHSIEKSWNDQKHGMQWVHVIHEAKESRFDNCKYNNNNNIYINVMYVPKIFGKE